jgi:hypothetical protein
MPLLSKKNFATEAIKINLNSKKDWSCSGKKENKKSKKN